MMQRESWSDDTATREFEPLRFPKARFARVIANADVAEGTLYPQFESKLGLLKALGEHDGTEMRAAFTAAEREPSPSERQNEEGDALEVTRRLPASLLPTTEPMAGEQVQPR